MNNYPIFHTISAWTANMSTGQFFSAFSLYGRCAKDSTNNTINPGSGYSAISGGSGNTVSAPYVYAGIFGCNITAVSSNAFHANNFVAQNMPLTVGSLGSGCFYIVPLGGGICVVGIS